MNWIIDSIKNKLIVKYMPTISGMLKPYYQTIGFDSLKTAQKLFL